MTLSSVHLVQRCTALLSLEPADLGARGLRRIKEDHIKDSRERLFSSIETFIFSLLLMIFGFAALVNEGNSKWLLAIKNP